MNAPITRVVIVGGGTAGWISAGVIAKKFEDHTDRDVSVTLIESSDIPTIGVGEGTWPTLRHTLKKIGISENDLVRQCDASFKQGAKFARWTTGADDDYYYHPFNVTEGYPRIDIAPYWVAGQDSSNHSRPLHGPGSFSDSTCWQEQLCEENLAPKQLSTPEYDDIANYAYHVDAGKLATLLKHHCTTKLGVNHIVDSVSAINQDESGFIKSVSTESKQTISGDLFIDCSGLAALLIGKTLGVPFVDQSNTLFIDRAIAMQVPYQDTGEIASHTISTAQKSGWIWDIGLSSRRGVGHVYSSRHCSDEEAEATLRNYIGGQETDLTSRKLQFNNGHRENFWVKNCVAIGLSAGFLEPLEATAIMLIEISATMIAEQFPPCTDVMHITASRFNEAFHYRWRAIIDFLKLHYVLSKRPEPFWKDNRAASTIPDSLQQLLTLWKYQAPSDYDFSSQYELFRPPSYQFVLYGMGFTTNYSNLAHTLNKKSEADTYFDFVNQAKKRFSQTLPSHRELIDAVKQYGFQAI